MKKKLCKCGCGNYAEIGRDFIYGHANRGRTSPMKGRKHTEEALKNMSIAQTGRKCTKEARKNMSIGKKKYFEDPEACIRNSCAQQGITREEWKGFIKQEPYCQIWTKEYKEFIKERDGWKCLNPKCWKTSKTICGHHIDYNKKNCEP